MMRKLLLTLVLFGFAGGAQAALIDTVLWSPTAEGPSTNAVGTTGWTVGGISATRLGNGSGALISNFSLSGDFTFSGKFQTTSSDDENVGMVFGWQDSANHYRLGWEGNGFGDIAGGGFGSSGANGLWLVREQAGVGAILFELPTTFYTVSAGGPVYDFTIARSDNDIFFSIDNGATNIASATVADSTFLSGAVGVYVESQQAQFTDLAADEISVPEPGTIALFGRGLIGLSLARQRTARK